MGVAFVSGLMMIALGLLKLGFITFYLSESFFTAFTSAAAVHIGTSQVPAMLGLKVFGMRSDEMRLEEME